MRKKDVKVPIPIEMFQDLKQLAETLSGKTVEIVNPVPEKKSMPKFLEAYARTGSIKLARNLVGLPKTTYYRYQRRNPEFKKRCDEIKERLQAKAQEERTAGDRLVSLARRLKDFAGKVLDVTEDLAAGTNDDES